MERYNIYIELEDDCCCGHDHDHDEHDHDHECGCDHDYDECEYEIVGYYIKDGEIAVYEPDFYIDSLSACISDERMFYGDKAKGAIPFFEDMLADRYQVTGAEKPSWKYWKYLIVRVE